MASKKQKQGKRTPAYSTDTMVVCLIVGLLLVALGVLILLANALGMAGDVFDGLRQFSRGMCGALATVLSVIPIWGGVLVILSTQKKPALRPFLIACLLFGMCSGLKVVVGTTNAAVSAQLISMIPYVVTLVVLVLFVGKSRVPAAGGKPFVRTK